MVYFFAIFLLPYTVRDNLHTINPVIIQFLNSSVKLKIDIIVKGNAVVKVVDRCIGNKI